MVNDNWPGRSYKKKETIAVLPIENAEMTAPITSWQDADTGLLTTANEVVNKRDEQYGQCYDHHADTAAMWSVYLGHTVLPEQVSVMFILDKVVRSKTEDKPDHWVDAAGYSAVHAKVQAEAECQNG